MQVPSMASPPVEAFAGARALGTPLTAMPVLAPGTVAVITPPSHGNVTLPWELPETPTLASIANPLLGEQPQRMFPTCMRFNFSPHLQFARHYIQQLHGRKQELSCVQQRSPCSAIW